ncbi:hypothetical protein E4U17_000796 [Claviceps sp. LM77 group G4]|nr:hypothetical protein E4U17_000796 [Claviceps sp. LM77 group G4]KAG6068730.1 hypothetical protein E4U33_005005 [Claviceps sp. LM78 group G4]KAG6085106.1 hypothetical protein E4U16_007845 [Claviceps sp. LM84 group G4]
MNSDRPYCNTYAFPGDITAYRCDSISDSSATTVQTTSAAQLGSRTYSKYVRFVQPLQSSLNSGSKLENTIISAILKATRSSDTTILTTTSIATRAPYGSSGDDCYEPPDISLGRKTPIGAIVGGVIGGVAALGAVVLITLFYLRRRKRRTAGTTEAPPSSRPIMQSKASPEMSMAQNQASNDSNPNDGSESLQTGSASAHAQQHQSGVCELQGQQRQEPSIHELPSQTSHHHRGQMHELA